MKTPYNSHYKTDALFGLPHPDLVHFFESLPKRGRVLDLGCGQGRNALPLARMGYEVTGLDLSKVGIDQILKAAEKEGLKLKALVGDVYAFADFQKYDIILLDSMFHFTKNQKEKEIGLIQNITANMQEGSLQVHCIQDQGKKVNTLKQAFESNKPLKIVKDLPFIYTFEDRANGHRSDTPCRLVVVER